MLDSDFNEKVNDSIYSDKAFTFMNGIKEPQHIGKSFYLMYWLWLESQLYL